MGSMPSYSKLDKYAGLSSGDISPYTAKAQSIETADQVGYYRMNEAAGVVAIDLSPAVNDGDYTSVTLAETGIGDGETSALFDGVNSIVDVAKVIVDLDPDNFTLNVWIKVSNVANWTDGSQDNIIAIAGDADNGMYICKAVGNNNVGFSYKAAGIDSTVHMPGISPVDWFTVGMTVDSVGNVKRNFYNGIQVGADQADFGAWGVGVATIKIGEVWNGWMAHVLIINKPTSILNMARLARL